MLFLLSLILAVSSLTSTDYDDLLRESLEGKSYDLSENSYIPDQIDLSRRTRLSLKRMCIYKNSVGCVVEMGCSVALGGFSGLQSTNLKVHSVETSPSTECTLRDHDVCRDVQMTMSGRMEKLKTQTQGSLYITFMGQVFTLDGNLNIKFKNMQASVRSSIHGSAEIGERCLAEKPLVKQLSFDSFEYDGIDFDFDFNGLFGASMDLKNYVSEKDLENALGQMFIEGSELQQQAAFETQHWLGNLWSRIINGMSSMIRFSVKEPAELCGN